MRRSEVGLAFAIALVLSGCSKEATGQTVAVVNNEEVSQAELNAELATTNLPPSADKKKVLPAVLQRVVDRKLLAQAAAEEGIDRTPEYVTRQRKMNEELLVQMMVERRAQSIKLPTASELDTFIQQNPWMFGEHAVLQLDQIVFDAPADLSVLKQFQDSHSLDSVAAILTRLGIPFSKGQARLDSATVEPKVAKQIAALPPGEPFVVPSAGKVVVSVITGRQAVPVPPDQARKLAADAIRRQKLGELLDSRLKELRSSGKISYQSGFAPPAAQPKK